MKKIISGFLLICLTLISCNKTNEREKEEMDLYLLKGKSITKETFKALSKELINSISQGGVIYALKYCKANALPIVDSLSKVHNVAIRRVSDKFRNANDRPTKFELKIIESYQTDLKYKKKIIPRIERMGNAFHYVAPIVIDNPICLNCHGIPGEELAYNTLTEIQSHYPADKALGYKLNDLRGIWHIEFARKD